MIRIITLALALLCCLRCINAAQLHELARQGDVAQIQVLLAADPMQVTTTDVKYFDGTALHVAAEHNQTEVVKLLLTHGAAVDTRDNRGATPLILAAKYGSKEMITCLLQAKADINITPRRQDLYPLLHRMVMSGDIEMIKYVLDHGGNINIRSYADGRTALHIAASIEDGSNINPATGNWYYGGPIDAATGKPHLLPGSEIITLLLKRGANIEARNAVGETPLFSAIRSNQVKNAALLLDKGANLQALDGYGRTALFHARDETSVFFLVKTMKMDVNSIELVNGSTPLQCAQLAAVKRALIACGATTTVPAPTQSEDALSIFRAVQSGDNAETKRLLAKNPQLIHAQESTGHGWQSWGNTLLHEASSVEVASTLLAAGANINQKNYGDFTPLHIAARAGNVALVRFFIAKGADIEARTLDFETPLHWAAVMGKEDGVMALLTTKANPRALNHQLQTPLDRAREQRMPSPGVVALLEESMKP